MTTGDCQHTCAACVLLNKNAAFNGLNRDFYHNILEIQNRALEVIAHVNN